MKSGDESKLAVVMETTHLLDGAASCAPAIGELQHATLCSRPSDRDARLDSSAQAPMAGTGADLRLRAGRENTGPER